MKTPWQYAETGNEYSHQAALFQWANAAASFGLRAANDPFSYTVKGYALNVRGNDLMPQLRWLHAIKNSGHGDAVRGARSAAEGVKAGVPDLFLPVPRFRSTVQARVFGLYIELKRPLSSAKAKGRVSDIQIVWQTYLQEAGYCVKVCYGWEAARDCLLKYLEG